MILNKLYKLYKKINSKRLFIKYRKLSFSQSGEDLIIKSIFDSLGINKPSYIDIGAHHPYYLSNTALLYDNASRGINIEPDPILFREFINYRKDDINLNIGIGSSNSELDFYIISTPSLNTFSKEEAEKYSEQGDYRITSIKKVKVNTIDSVLSKFSNNKFPHFLSIDAEGVDELIIRNIDFKSNYPIVICIETISFSTSGNGKKNVNLINYIKENGYILYADTHINSIFVREEIWRRK